MKKIVLFISCGVMLGSCCNVKRLQREALIKTSPETLELIASEGDNPIVDVEFALQIPKKYVPKCSQMLFQPQFLTSTENLNLTPVVINGKKRAKDEARMIKKGEELPYANAIRVENDKNPVEVDYSVSAPISDWMPESELVGWTMLNCGKKTKEVVISRQVIASGIKMPQKPEPKPQTVTKDVTEDKDASKTTYFMVNSSEFDPNLDNNSAGVEKITNVMNKINSSPKNSLVAINIVGSASPEGKGEFNKELSMARANTVANMIASKFGVSKTIMKVSSVGANWKGFVEMIEKSSLMNRTDIIKIANSNMDDWQKTLALRNLFNYKVLVEEYLPKLRYTMCEIKYNITKSVTETVPATEVITIY